MARTITHGTHQVPAREYDDEREIEVTDKRTLSADEADEIDEVHEAQREDEVDQYTGINVGAAFFGWITAVGVTLLVTSILAALGVATAFNALTDGGTAALNAETAQDIGIAGGIAALIAIAIGYYAGGYVAGRMSRFDGAKQGAGVFAFGVGVMILVGMLAAALGDRFNLLQSVNLPAFINVDSLTSASIIGLVLTLVVMLLSAIAGGKVGERYHDKVDRAVFTH